jgi:PAS domain S-box-containing protein
MNNADAANEQLIIERDNLRRQLATLQAREIEYQKQAQVLHNREREITALLGITPNAVIARFDRDLRHTHVNAAVRLATGIPPEAYIGKTSGEMGMTGDALYLFETTLRNVFTQAQESTIEYAVVVNARKWVFESNVIPEIDSNSEVMSVLAITRDITRQKQSEESLLEHTEILETVRDVGQVLSAELDLQKLVQFVTDAATEISGAEFGSFFYNLQDERGESYTLYTLSGVPLEAFSRFPMPRNTDLFGPTFRGEGIVRIDDVHNDPRYGHNDPHYGMPQGHLPVTSYLAVPVISRSRKVLGGLFFGHSAAGVFTERHERIVEGLAAQAAVALDNAHLYREAHDQQSRLQITLASIGDAVIATDSGGHITFMNKVAQTLTGWSDSDAIGKPLEQVFRIVNEFTRETAESPVVKVLREGKIVGLANHTLLLARDGTEIPIDDSGAPIFDESRTLVGVILVFRDITERRDNEHRINLLLKLSSAFSQSLTSNQIAEVIVEQGLKELGALVGTVALMVEQGTALEIINRHGLSQDSFEKYRRTPLDFPGPLNDAVRSGDIIWIESFEDYVARYPHFADAIKNNGSRSTVCIPLKVNEKIIGGFNLSFPFNKLRNPAEEAFFMALAQQCAQSLERASLQEQAQEVAALQERQRLARDLHDAVSQVLFSSTAIAETVPRMWAHDPAKAIDQLNNVVMLNRAAMAEMRTLLLELRPETIVRTDLSQLLEQLLKAVKGRKLIEAELTIEGTEYFLPDDVHVAFYRIAQEAINNVVKHSRASLIQVNFHYRTEQVDLTIRDNGQGFDTQQVAGGLGQSTMRERAKAINSLFKVVSEPGAGTHITLVWNPPMPSSD